MKIKIPFILLSGLLSATSAVAYEQQAFEMIMGQVHKTPGAFRWLRPEDVPRVMILRSTPQLLQRLGPVSQPHPQAQAAEADDTEEQPAVQLSDAGDIPYTNPDLIRSPIS